MGVLGTKLGDSFSDAVVKSKITTSKQRNSGPSMAPSGPNQNIPPAIDRPVKYGCPPLKENE